MSTSSLQQSEPCWTIVGFEESNDSPSADKLKEQLEKGSEQVKVETMKRVLGLMMNGDPLPQLMMTVIRFILPSKSKMLKKLMLVYWELCPKYGADGKLKQEMILVCNYIRNDLQSPNEYVRGMTLKFLSRVREVEILEPLVPSVRSGLEHRHPYVRKNAVMAVFSIYKAHEHLIPDAPELIHNYIQQEQDFTCRRNALLMLANCDAPRAVSYIASVFPQIPTFDENLKLAIIELVKRDSVSNYAAKGKYISLIVSFLESSSPAVKFEAAHALVGLTNSNMAMKEVAKCFISLAVKEADNNIKLIVLDRLRDLAKENGKILAELSIDLLRVLSSTDIEVCRKAINIVLDSLNGRNVTAVVSYFTNEIAKTHEPKSDKNADYRQLLIHAVHQCAVKFPSAAPAVVDILMEFLNETHGSAAVDVITFIREVVERNETLRDHVVESLLKNFLELRTGKVLRGALWILGEFCLDVNIIKMAFKQIRASIGDLPIVASEMKALEDRENSSVAENEAKPVTPQPATRVKTRKVLADGTYASESVFTATNASPAVTKDPTKPPLRSVIMGGDYFISTVLATSLTKLVLRLVTYRAPAEVLNSLRAEAMLIMVSIIRAGQSQFVTSLIDEDSVDRIHLCLRVLATQDKEMITIFTKLTREVFTKLVQHGDKEKAAKKANGLKSSAVPVDQLIMFSQLKSSQQSAGGDGDLANDLKLARGADDFKSRIANQLDRMVQLTGFSDSVYAEAFVDIHQYDIMLDILIVNQTTETLQNLNLEFSMIGDLKLVERPTPRSMGPHAFASIKVNFKVSSTETGVIFGNIVYDGSHVGESHVVILNDIRLDIMDYIKPAECSENDFRLMWAEFEWENKMPVDTNIKDLREFLKHVLKMTNMGCLTPEAALEGDCGFLAANMYAKSIFGEDAVGNIALEKTDEDKIAGFIRIRSKSQGIALSLGDKITLSQKQIRI